MTPTRKPKASRASLKKKGKQTASVVRKSNELRIRFANSHQLLDTLHSEAHSISLLHSYHLLTSDAGAGRATATPAAIEVGDGPTTQTAIDIVTGCASDTDLTATLGDIPGLDPQIFQSCVYSKATAAGFHPGTIPASSSTTLAQVVQAVVGNPH
jgi:hypothetical protein